MEIAKKQKLDQGQERKIILPSRKFHVLYSTSMKKVAKQVYEDLYNKGCQITKGGIEWKFFPDKFPNLFIKKVDHIKGKHIIYVASLIDQSEFFAQISILYSLALYGAKSINLVLPYFPVGTMERIDKEGQIATAKVLAQLISNIPRASCLNQLFVWDIHALQNRFYFGDSVVPNICSAIPLLKERLFQLPEHKNGKVVICFPDEGAEKRFGPMFPEFPKKFVCTKKRQGEERIVTLKEDESTFKIFEQGLHIVIVDDLVHTGGTLKKCKDAIMKYKSFSGTWKVSLFITHGVFDNSSFKGFYDQGFEHIWMTDSVPETVDLIEKHDPDSKMFEFLPLHTSISNEILHTYA